METIDLRKELRHLYSPRAGRFEVIDIPELSYLTITGRIEAGHGPSDSPGFDASVGALYGLAYTLKFALKKRAENPIDFPVMPLQGQWGLSSGEFDLANPNNWTYRLLIVVPDAVTADDVSAALDALRAKRGAEPAFDRLRLERFAAGRYAQIMHVGPYATEPQTLAALPAFLAEHGLVDRMGAAGGEHEEVYLGDPRRADPEKLRTILRHPVAEA